MASIPALFVSHGSPMFALEPGSTGAALARCGERLRAQGVRAVVAFSPHWMADRAHVTMSAAPATWHDFGGFPAPLYALQYPAPGDPALAQRVLGLLAGAGFSGQGDDQRPFDHGAWVPMRHLFAQADVPLLQVALPASAGPREVYAMGQALQPLCAQGVLVLGSGSMTHNLADFFGGAQAPAPYVEAFSRWVQAAVERCDLVALFDYRQRAPYAARAHPSEEHFLPLFVALGAAGPAWRTEALSREVAYGVLAMDALALHPAID